jgi:hypothetical protein
VKVKQQQQQQKKGTGETILGNHLARKNESDQNPILNKNNNEEYLRVRF